MKKTLILKEGMMISGRKVKKIFRWKVYYDEEDKMVCGEFDPRTKVNKIVVALLNEQLPNLINKPQWIAEKEAVLIVFDK
jgi:hypothetical protein